MKETIKRLLYLRREIDQIIENCITENALRDKPIDKDALRESLIYHIDDHLERLSPNQK